MSLGSWALPTTACNLIHVTRAGRGAETPGHSAPPKERVRGSAGAPPWRRARPFAGSGDRGPPARAASRFPPPPAAGSLQPRAEEKSRRPRAEAALGRVAMVTAGDKEPAAPGDGGGVGLRGPPSGASARRRSARGSGWPRASLSRLGPQFPCLDSGPGHTGSSDLSLGLATLSLPFTASSLGKMNQSGGSS